MEIQENRRIEKRIWRDPNGLYHLQIRRVPVYSWEDDGWVTMYASNFLREVLPKYYGKEF